MVSDFDITKFMNENSTNWYDVKILKKSSKNLTFHFFCKQSMRASKNISMLMKKRPLRGFTDNKRKGTF